MAIWHVDVLASGGNDGTSQADAWENIRSAFESGAVSGGDFIRIRDGAAQVHTMTASDCNIASSGSPGAPITVIGDNTSLNFWPDASDIKPKVDWGANAKEFKFNGDDYWVIKNLEFTKGEGETIGMSGCWGMRIENCDFTDDGQTPLMFIYAFNGTDCVIKDCTFDGLASFQVRATNGSRLVVQGCTFDDSNSDGLSASTGAAVLLENCTFGATTENDDSDIELTVGAVIVGRAVNLNSATEIVVNTARVNELAGGHIALEDYGGVKGAWFYETATALMESLAAASTSAGQRSGGSETVIKVSPKSGVSAHLPTLVKEWVLPVSGGTPYVDWWLQPDNTWAAVPVINGAGAEIYVEVMAWDSGTGQYVTRDSRDEAQGVLVEGAWGKIRLDNVLIDTAGTIIVRLWAFAYESGKFWHMDRLPEVEDENAFQEPPFVLDNALLLPSAADPDYPDPSEMLVGTSCANGTIVGTAVGVEHFSRVTVRPTVTVRAK